MVVLKIWYFVFGFCFEIWLWKQFGLLIPKKSSLCHVLFIFFFFFFFVLLFLFLTPKLNCVGGLSSSCLSLFPSLEQTCFLFPLLPSLLIFVFWPDQSSATHINGQEYWIIWYCKAKVTTYYLNSSSLLVDHAFLTLKTFESIDNPHKLTQFCFFFFSLRN